jgi:hypothetical protein
MKDGGEGSGNPNNEPTRNVPAGSPCDPLLLYGPHAERKPSLLIQIVASLLIMGAFVLVAFLLST